MSPLALIKRSIERKQALKAAQLAHLQATAYRGVANAYAKSFPIKRDPVVLTYRGQAYLSE